MEVEYCVPTIIDTLWGSLNDKKYLRSRLQELARTLTVKRKR